jgi:hypothetical protein
MHKLLKKIKKYSFGEKVALIFFVLYTKIVIPNARIVRYPIDIRGKRILNLVKDLLRDTIVV